MIATASGEPACSATLGTIRRIDVSGASDAITGGDGPAIQPLRGGVRGVHPLDPGAVRGGRRGQAGHLSATTRLKNPDFLLYPRFGTNLVVEVKGKRGKNARGRRDWENWVTTDDLDGLVRWQAMFGPGFRAVLAFAYAEPIQPFPLPRRQRGLRVPGLEYRFWAVGLDDYIAHLRSRGPAWKAVAMARRAFRRRVRPLLEWLPMSYDWARRPTPVKERQR